MIIDEQRGLQPAQGDPGDQGESPRENHQQSSNGQASHRGLIPRARVKVKVRAEVLHQHTVSMSQTNRKLGTGSKDGW